MDFTSITSHILLGSSSFTVVSFCLFELFMGFSGQQCWSGLPFPSPVDHILSDLSTVTRQSWVVGGFFTSSATWEAPIVNTCTHIFAYIYIYIHLSPKTRETKAKINQMEPESESCSTVSYFLWPRGLYSSWNSPGQNTGVGSRSLLQGIFPTQGLNPGLPHCRWILYQLSHQGSPLKACGQQRKSLTMRIDNMLNQRGYL